MPRNALSWTGQEARLRNARALAVFLDLEAFGVANFRRKYPDFLPPMLWTAKSMTGDESDELLLWQQMQTQLWEVWRKGFLEKDVLETISSSHTLLDFAIAYDKVSLDAYRKALLFLHTESWRARICKACECHFVANHSRSECCSVQCAANWRTYYKAERHKRVKKELNARRRREYRAAKRRNEKGSKQRKAKSKRIK